MQENFSSLGICDALLNILKKNGIEAPTPVQQQAIPAILDKKDVIAQAQTGTGKTLAFLLPLFQQIDPTKSHIQALIIAPTRELALQIANEARKLTSFKDIQVLTIFGGEDVEKQMHQLKSAVHLVIGTSGRLLDHLQRKTVDFSKLSTLVLDEVDQITDMGFFPEVEKVIQGLPRKRQTLLFSATVTRAVRKVTAKFTKNPHQVMIQTKHITLDNILQKVIHTKESEKKEALCKILDAENPFMAIIFCHTKQRATALNIALQGSGYDADALQGDMEPSKRKKVMKTFRNLKLQLLVATDIAARGLDIEGVTHIINYDMPADTQSYIHRIGRTGRAGQTGTAITLATPEDRETIRAIEVGIRAKMDTEKNKEALLQKSPDKNSKAFASQFTTQKANWRRTPIRGQKRR